MCDEVSKCKACGAIDSIFHGDAGMCMECGTAEDYTYIDIEERDGPVSESSLSSLINDFCSHFNILLSDLTKRSRKEHLVKKKKMLCGYTNEYEYGHSEVANILGLHHSTVIHHRKDHENRIETDKRYRREYRRLICSTSSH
jgi:chromosomal replication initiation ATPase DnaA